MFRRDALPHPSTQSEGRKKWVRPGNESSTVAGGCSVGCLPYVVYINYYGYGYLWFDLCTPTGGRRDLTELDRKSCHNFRLV